MSDTNRLNKPIPKSSNVVGLECDSDSGVREEDDDQATEDLGQRLTATSIMCWSDIEVLSTRDLSHLSE